MIYLIYIFPIVILLWIIAEIFFHYWYRKNYLTKESTDKYDNGWHKCWNCKTVESTMYFTYNSLSRRIYKCSKCSKI